jgi:hypothetical protein
MRRLITLASVATCALTALGATVPATTAAGHDTATPALAYPTWRVTVAQAEDQCFEWAQAAPGAEVCYREAGDYLYVCDLEADGYRAWAQVSYREEYSRYTTDYGAGYCTVHNWDLASENHWIWWQAEVWNGSDYLYQSTWKSGPV